MKTIIVLTFFGILGCTFCEHVSTWPEGCRNVHDQAASDFQFDKFFTGSWYLTYAKYQNVTTDCMKFDMSLEPQQITYQLNGKPVSCGITKVPGARYTEYKCKRDEIPEYEAIISVIDTDYNSYATVYKCMKAGNHEENVYVLSRNKADEPPEKAKQSLQKLGEQIETFIKYECT